MRILFAVCLACALGTTALGQCRPPRFQKGRDFIDSTTGTGSLYVSLRLGDFTLNKLICLAETLRSRNPNWSNVGILVFSSRDAAFNFQASHADYEDPAAWKRWAKQLHASYFFNADKHEEYLEIMPLGYEGAPSNDSRIDLPLTTAPRCRLEISNRCVIVVEGINYPPEALQAMTSGSITLSGSITRNGEFHEIHVVQGDVSPPEERKLLNSAAIRSLSRWRVEPAPRRDTIRITYSYVIANSSNPGTQAGVQFQLPTQVIIRALRSE